MRIVHIRLKTPTVIYKFQLPPVSLLPIHNNHKVHTLKNCLRNSITILSPSLFFKILSQILTICPHNVIMDWGGSQDEKKKYSKPN